MHFLRIFAYVGLSMGVAFAADGPQRREVEIVLHDNQIRAAGIETQSITADAGSGEFVASGVVIVPPQQARVVAAPGAGLIEAILVTADQDVQAGEPVARLKSSDLVEGQRAFLAALSDATLANEKLRRDEQLFRERIIAERRLIVTRAEARQADLLFAERSQLLGLQGMSEADIAALQTNRQIANALVVRAPIAGTVLSRQGAVGERVPASSPLMTIALLDPIWVNLQAPLASAPALEKIDQVFLPAFGLKGRIVRVGRTVDAATQSISVIAEFSPGKVAIRPGQVVQALMPIKNSTGKQWRAPASAVTVFDGRSWVFVRTPRGFRATAVDVVATTAQFATIQGDLTASDMVAVRGVLALLAELSAATATK